MSGRSASILAAKILVRTYRVVRGGKTHPGDRRRPPSCGMSVRPVSTDYASRLPAQPTATVSRSKRICPNRVGMSSHNRWQPDPVQTLLPGRRRGEVVAGDDVGQPVGLGHLHPGLRRELCDLCGVGRTVLTQVHNPPEEALVEPRR